MGSEKCMHNFGQISQGTANSRHGWEVATKRDVGNIGYESVD
jgi:hypothetical protein